MLNCLEKPGSSCFIRLYYKIFKQVSDRADGGGDPSTEPNSVSLLHPSNHVLRMNLLTCTCSASTCLCVDFELVH